MFFRVATIASALILLHIHAGDVMALPKYNFEPHGFIEVNNMDGSKYPVSPAVPRIAYWRGVVVSAPDKVIVRIEKDEKYPSVQIPIPFCAAYTLELPDLNDICSTELHLRNEENGVTYQGKVSCRDGDRNFYPLSLPYDSEPRSAVSAYMSYDIHKYVTLPMTTAKYSFWTITGATKSNTIFIEIEVIREQE